MLEWIKIVILGIIEGLTEFLPVSSTGHLLLAARLLNFQQDVQGTFEIFIQFGAVVAVIGYFFRDLLAKLQAAKDDAASRRFLMNVALAFVPAAAIGFLLSDWIKSVLFASPRVIAGSLIIGGVIMILVERLLPSPNTLLGLLNVSWRQALGTGLLQILALVPGVSRSASTIIGGMLTGMDRATATQFSFYLAIPTLGIATLYDLYKSIDQISMHDLSELLVGAVVAGIVAWLSIRWLLNYVARNTFIAFGIYRVAIGFVILALLAAGLL
jgi:undecaprenyl-diphosphatase